MTRKHTLTALLLLALLLLIRLLRADEQTDWGVAHYSAADAKTITLLCQKDGEQPVVVGSVSTDDDTPGLRLAELRTEAERICDQLNDTKGTTE